MKSKSLYVGPESSWIWLFLLNSPKVEKSVKNLNDTNTSGAIVCII